VKNEFTHKIMPRFALREPRGTLMYIIIIFSIIVVYELELHFHTIKWQARWDYCPRDFIAKALNAVKMEKVVSGRCS
jgi:hypothetical protein